MVEQTAEKTVRIPYSARGFTSMEHELGIRQTVISDLFVKPLQMHNPAFRNSYEDKSWEESIASTPLLLTRVPVEVFGDQPLYHVTGSNALASIVEGKPLLPPISHPEAGIVTQRRSGLFLAEALLEVVGVEMLTKKTGVFAGQLIDAQQLLGERMLICESNDWLQKEVVLAREEDDPQYHTPVYHFQPALLEVFKNLEEEGNLINASKATKDWLRETLAKIANRYLLREGWYQSMKQLFEGERSVTNFDLENAKGKLYFALFDWETVQAHSKPAVANQEVAVVMKINQETLNKSYGSNVPVLFGGRDPGTIRYMPYVSATAIEEVYVLPGDEKYLDAEKINRAGIPIRATTDLPRSLWLGNLTPEDAGSWAEVDPLNPVCDIRYAGVRNGGVVQSWRKWTKEGNLTYAWDFDIKPEDLKTCLGIESPKPVPAREVFLDLHNQHLAEKK